MVIRVGINGFGRVGRIVFRACYEHPDIEICAINDPALEVDYVSYLMKYDSTHGTLDAVITHNKNEVEINGSCVKVFQEKLPSKVPWQTADVQYVVEASGMFTNKEAASGHLLQDGVRRVILTAPSVDVPMIILGVNENKITTDKKVLSCGSSTLYCLAPIIHVLETNYGVEEGFVTSIHAMTPSLKPLDGLCFKGKHWRDHRSVMQNIIPAATGACKALARVMPAMRDRLCGMAFRVPIANVSVLDISIKLKKTTSIQCIAAAVEKYRKSMKEKVIKNTTDDVVSSDFIGDCYSCILDVGSCLQLKPNSFKLVCWYENEYSYACRVIDLIFFSEAQLVKDNASQGHARSSCYQPAISKNSELHRHTEINIPTATKGDVKDKVHEPAGLMPIRPSQLQKPKDIKKTAPSGDKGLNSLNKIWEDVNATLPKSGSIFRESKCKSNDGLQTPCSRAQERLELVKREFTKMVNITEDLLRKSGKTKVNCDPKISNESKSDLTFVSTKNNEHEKKSERNKELENKSIVINEDISISDNKVSNENTINRDENSHIERKKDENFNDTIQFSDSMLNTRNSAICNYEMDSCMGNDDDKSQYSSICSNRKIQPDNPKVLWAEEKQKRFLYKRKDKIIQQIQDFFASDAIAENRKQDKNIRRYQDKIVNDQIRLEIQKNDTKMQQIEDKFMKEQNRVENKNKDRKKHLTDEKSRIKQKTVNENLLQKYPLNEQNKTDNKNQMEFIKKFQEKSFNTQQKIKDTNQDGIQFKFVHKQETVIDLSQNRIFQQIQEKSANEQKDLEKHQSETLYKEKTTENKIKDKKFIQIPKKLDTGPDVRKRFENKNQLIIKQFKEMSNDDQKTIRNENIEIQEKMSGYENMNQNKIIQNFQPKTHSDNQFIVTKALSNIISGLSHSLLLRPLQLRNAEVPGLVELGPKPKCISNADIKLSKPMIATSDLQIKESVLLKNRETIIFGKSPILQFVIQNTINTIATNDTKSDVVTNVLFKKEPKESSEKYRIEEISAKSSNTGNRQCGDIVRVTDKDDDSSKSGEGGEKETPLRYMHDSEIFLDTRSSPSYSSNCPGKQQDIFDKLDSVSDSGSENSFETSKKTSQIIAISELTNSLDDLERLDKICRIIEISDELSDKLLSPLDKKASGSNRPKDGKAPWSFKDLCDKVNLDEFCNKVFGK